jgi:hypothetical protein
MENWKERYIKELMSAFVLYNKNKDKSIGLGYAMFPHFHESKYFPFKFIENLLKEQEKQHKEELETLRFMIRSDEKRHKEQLKEVIDYVGCEVIEKGMGYDWKGSISQKEVYKRYGISNILEKKEELDGYDENGFPNGFGNADFTEDL